MDHSTTVSTSVATQPRSSSFRRIVAATLTAALAAGGLSVIAAAAPASAAVTDTVSDATLTWGLQNTAAGWGVTTTGDVELVGATTAADYVKATAFTLTDGTGTISPTGTGTLDFDGSVTYSPFAAYGTLTYHSTFTLADFELNVTSATRGELTADVTWQKEASAKTEASRVTVANFDITSLSVIDGEFALQTAAPDFANTVPAGKYNGTFTDAWPTSFVDALLPLASASDIPVYFYRTGTTAGNTNKTPLAFSAAATVATPVVTPTVTSETFEGGYVVSLAGDGFRPALNPGDSGVYVGIAPAGGHPGFASADIAKFVVADWVNAASIVNGTFTRTLTADATKLDPNVDYSIYTWQAHTHSNTTQDTETALPIDFEALERYSSSLTLAADTTVVYGSDATLTATVANGTGSVEFFEGETSVGTADVVDGVATLAVSDLAVGDHTFSAKYLGDDHYAASTSSQSLVTVERAVAGDVVLSLSTAKQVYGLGTTATVTIPAATGDVALLVDDKTVGTATLADGIATIALPTTLAVGNHSVVASYAGTETVLPQDSDAVALKVNKASASSLTVSGKSYKKNTAPVVTVKIGKLNNGLYANGTVKIFIGSKVVKTVSIYTTNKGTISVTLPKQTKSSIPVKAAYYGSTKINAKNSATVRITRK